jgi:hypothetical protein
MLMTVPFRRQLQWNHHLKSPHACILTLPNTRNRNAKHAGRLRMADVFFPRRCHAFRIAARISATCSAKREKSLTFREMRPAKKEPRGGATETTEAANEGTEGPYMRVTGVHVSMSKDLGKVLELDPARFRVHGTVELNGSALMMGYPLCYPSRGEKG